MFRLIYATLINNKVSDEDLEKSLQEIGKIKNSLREVKFSVLGMFMVHDAVASLEKALRREINRRQRENGKEQAESANTAKEKD